ncbi:DUF6527 family protein [Actinomadura sp. 3N508]|uniref:DUF6527 family protein n=1 Tax=Actinomadura sp. 3N508 TaxID=3375153 RepID=UPI0037A05F45
MTRVVTLAHQFVDHAPETLKEGILYISIPFTSALHLCCCGCGREVVTPLTPRDWRLIFDGQTVSLEPSIGNWNFPCRSHYWIHGSKVRWLPRRPMDHIDVDRAPIRTQTETSFGTSEIRRWSGRLRRLLGRIRHKVLRRGQGREVGQ